MRAHTSDEQEGARPEALARRCADASGVLKLQALAGNRAVGSVVDGRAPVPVQRVLELTGKRFANKAEIASDAEVWKAWREWADPDKETKLSAPEVHQLPPAAAPASAAVGAGVPAVAVPSPAAAAVAVPAAAPVPAVPGPNWVKRRDTALNEVYGEVMRVVNNPKTKAGNYFAGGLTVTGIVGAERTMFNKAVRRAAQADRWGVADGPGATVAVVWGKAGKGQNFNVLVGDGHNASKWNIHFIY